jgi:hypothetical protein
MRPYDLQSVDPLKTYAVQLLQFDGRTSTAGVYDSPTGKLLRVDDVSPVDESGGRARVTAASRSDHPPIRADLPQLGRPGGRSDRASAMSSGCPCSIARLKFALEGFRAVTVSGGDGELDENR